MDALARTPDLDIASADSTEGFIAALDGAQVAVLPGLPRFYGPDVAAKIASSSDIAWVHLISAGYDGVSAAGWPPGVRFTHPGGALSGAVAEHAFALLTALSRRLDQAVLGQVRQAWGKPYAQQTSTLSGATLAVVGFGSIGQRVAKLARGYDMTVIGVSRSGRPVEGYEVHAAGDLLDVLPRADAVICALPYDDETRHLLDAQAFAC
ncbi:MAG TPA: NAD(P)-dependent oxidoreductase, partial [Caulobacteraceae bacterium]|nr:NAD(P)-dependent oxidoreductase [Caulobacteraceae bacterium]